MIIRKSQGYISGSIHRFETWAAKSKTPFLTMGSNFGGNTEWPLQSNLLSELRLVEDGLRLSQHARCLSSRLAEILVAVASTIFGRNGEALSHQHGDCHIGLRMTCLIGSVQTLPFAKG